MATFTGLCLLLGDFTMVCKCSSFLATWCYNHKVNKPGGLAGISVVLIKNKRVLRTLMVTLGNKEWCNGGLMDLTDFWGV